LVETGKRPLTRFRKKTNMLFMMFIIRAGIQILADHPRLYWNRDCTPGTEWFRFQHPVPHGRIWTAKDPALPGGGRNYALGRSAHGGPARAFQERGFSP
jgi:hypothetical protein